VVLDPMREHGKPFIEVSGEARKCANGSEEKPGLFIPTSGSTGAPKLIFRDMDTWQWETDRYQALLEPSNSDHILLCSPLSHAYSLGWLWMALLGGRRLELVEPNALGLAITAITQRADMVALTPAIAKLLAKRRHIKNTSPGPGKLKIVMAGAGAVSATLDLGIVDSIISANFIGTESEYIIDSFRDIKEFTKNHPTAYYQSEFMYRDFYFDYPDSTNAEVAKELADSLIPKIEVFNKDKSHRIKEITSNIYNFDKLYKARKFKEISEKLKGLFDEEKGYITKHIMGELIKEYNYLDITMEAIDKLIQNKKSTPISAGIVGIKFKGSLVRANKESLSIKTQMGTISLPWKKN
ncbi:MAG: hypothetical protein COA79_23140, partial [Planctomycetota bacterium]